MTEAAVRPPGRPRSAQADSAIVDAALALLVEEGFDRLSMDGVAAKAGVSKATIYRRWPSKEALVIEAVARRTDPFADAPTEGSARDRLVALLQTVLATSRTTLGKLLPCMVGATVSNPTLARHYREHILDPRRARIGEILRSGIEAGELRSGIDVDLAIDQVVGPLLYRVVFAGDENPVTDEQCAAYVDSLLTGLAP
ncbi:MAG TPA: TetR/AcrR family transcriptional regulator [Frankiaceae bacterium]|nr:TetR/AcrR family transcriptional regulator [Frankiaceae bacterium]